MAEEMAEEMTVEKRAVVGREADGGEERVITVVMRAMMV